MGVILQVDKLTKSVGDRMLFADVCFGMEEGAKIGVVARNGAGKSTLLKIIAGDETPDSGTVTLRSGVKVGYLPQTPRFDESHTALEACMQGSFDKNNAHEKEQKAVRLLTQMGVNATDTPIKSLSGGERKRIAIVRLLIEEPDLLILDEPTNHLDIPTIEWLESYLKRQRMTLLLVTHDRYFLDRVCSRIIEIDANTVYSYDGNYDYFLRRRKERIEAMTAEAARLDNTLRREQEWMRRQPQARAGKAKYRIDAFYDMKQKRQGLRQNERNVSLDVKSGYIGSKIFEATNVSKRYGDKVILKDFSYIFSRYEKLGIVGKNGIGKSTFIKMLQGLIKPDSGYFDIGETVRFGYYTQDGIKFDESKKVIDAITEKAEEVVLAEGQKRLSPMQFLQRFLFSPADQQKYIHTLSGGERARLHLAEVLMEQPNFLVLDEPTNDLDIVTLGILEDYLNEFEGCLIVITHDRFFLDSTVDHLFVFQGDGEIKDFPGSYSEYIKFKADNESVQESGVAKKSSGKPKEQRTERARRLTFNERRELESLTAEIAELEKEKTLLEAIFSGSEQGDIDKAAARYDEVKNLLNDKEMRWLELSEIEG